MKKKIDMFSDIKKRPIMIENNDIHFFRKIIPKQGGRGLVNKTNY